MKILIFDIETKPSLAYIWSCWQNNVPINMVAESGEVLTWAAKWYGEKTIMSDTVWGSGLEACVLSLHDLIDQADALVAHNGTNFDIKVMNGMFLKLGLHPPAPAKMIDTLQVARARFKLLSNKLEYLAEYLGVGQKMATGGFALWEGCMAGDKKAQAKMLKYNKMDVTVLEGVYVKLLPWIKQHPNHGLLVDSTRPICTNCGSSNVHAKGHSYTKVAIYRRYKCVDCGTPLRGRHNQAKKNPNVLTQEI